MNDEYAVMAERLRKNLDDSDQHWSPPARQAGGLTRPEVGGVTLSRPPQLTKRQPIPEMRTSILGGWSDRRRMRRLIENEELKLEFLDVQTRIDNLERQAFHDEAMFGVNLMTEIMTSHYDMENLKLMHERKKEENRGVVLDNLLKEEAILQAKTNRELMAEKLNQLKIENQRNLHQLQVEMENNPLGKP